MSTSEREVSLVWFKRDLRVWDHEPLVEAARRGPTIALFVYEPELYAEPDFDSGHFTFQRECLLELAEAIRERGGTLVTRVGRFPEVLDDLAREVRFARVLTHQETGNAVTFARDRRVLAWCRARGVEFVEFLQHGVFRRLAERDGWARRWSALMNEPVLAAPARIEGVPVGSRGVLELADVGLPPSGKTDAWVGGESVALEVLEDFLERRGERYRTEMSSPESGEYACSRLSAHLAYGSISLRSVHQAVEERSRRLRALRADGEDIGRDWLQSLASFGKRLRWHCHFIQKLESEPRLEFENMARAYDGLREADFDLAKFDAFVAGRTGYPMVDACVRSLEKTGWLNFRMRAMLVSFASYDLWLHWRPTALFLARQFVDYEPGIHYSQVQMQSGVTGINALRIYSPTKQLRDQDPAGRFVRRWVPELEGVPLEHLAEPHRMTTSEQSRAGVRIGRDYPAPIVVHEERVKDAARRIGAIRRRSESREEAAAVYEKHGSRRRPDPRSRGTKKPSLVP